MAGTTSKTRIGYDEAPAKGMDKRVQDRSTGGLAGVSGARAQKPVKATVNANTVSESKTMVKARPTTGGPK